MIAEQEILNARILIVDDQEANIALLQQILADAGYTGMTSTMVPQEVCALHRRNCYDLILLDLQMPGMDGFQVMEALKTNDADAYLPVVVITAQPAHKLHALQAGAKDFVSKPFDLTEVKTRIHNMLEVRLLYKKLENYNKELERQVAERTAELRESEARFRSLTELASEVQTAQMAGWNETERALLQAAIAARKPFLDFSFSRIKPDGSKQQFSVSGEPMFDAYCRFIGYRGIGVETTAR